MPELVWEFILTTRFVSTWRQLDMRSRQLFHIIQAAEPGVKNRSARNFHSSLTTLRSHTFILRHYAAFDVRLEREKCPNALETISSKTTHLLTAVLKILSHRKIPTRRIAFSEASLSRNACQVLQSALARGHRRWQNRSVPTHHGRPVL
jgi:hypothetical protein